MKYDFKKRIILNYIRRFIMILECLVLFATERSEVIFLKSTASPAAVYNENWIIMETNSFNIIFI